MLNAVCPLELTRGNSGNHQELSCSGIAPNHQYLEDLFKHSDNLCALRVQTVQWIYTPDMINGLHHNKYILPIIKMANIKIEINRVIVSGQKTLV